MDSNEKNQEAMKKILSNWVKGFSTKVDSAEDTIGANTVDQKNYKSEKTAMNNILVNMNSAFGEIESSIGDVIVGVTTSGDMENNPLKTSAILNEENEIVGVEVKDYKIFSRPARRIGRKVYEVVEKNSETIILEHIKLYDTAQAIVKLLNSGESYYGNTVQKIVRLEESYSKHYADLLYLKRKSNSAADKLILETKFENAKFKALAAKAAIKEINKKI